MIELESIWQELEARVRICQNCELCKTRHNTVFGEGPTENPLCVIVGEAPGADEDMTGRPFVGKAGELLTQILERGGNIPRDQVYITNVVKCRPPENRNPTQSEQLACSEFLEAQLLLLRPKIVVAMGNISTQWLFKTKAGITKLRGQWLDWRGIKLFPMFHPSYLLRDPSRDKNSPKYLTWLDIRELHKKIFERE